MFLNHFLHLLFHTTNNRCYYDLKLCHLRLRPYHHHIDLHNHHKLQIHHLHPTQCLRALQPQLLTVHDKCQSLLNYDV